ncbi:MAG: hypothetical protein J6Y28_07315 [Acholeplasmatales bacterium]|nr:hypothetical protein [Acholeplasmatales bacterium]
MEKNEKRYEEIDGKKYVFIPCPYCKNELRFSLEPKGRRIYFMCKNCNKKMEMTIE